MASFPKSIRSIQIQNHGGIEVIEKHESPFPETSPSDIVIKVEYAGVNFIDTYQRAGVYPASKFPFALGQEASGEIVALPSSKDVLESGDYKIRGYKVGDKVAVYQSGSFSEYVAVPWAKVAKLPQGVDTKLGAAVMVQGLTALTGVREAYEVKKGDHILIHAAAGGLGLMFTQLVAHSGAIAIGTVSTPEKADIVKAHGAQHVIVSPRDAAISAPDAPSIIVREVLRITHNQGVEGIFDGVGKDTFEDDFLVAKRKATIVSLGNASGVVPPFSPLKLMPKNLKILRPTVMNYIYTPQEFLQYSTELFDLVAKGVLKVNIHKEYPFTAEGVQESQRDIAGRGTTGKLLIRF